MHRTPRKSRPGRTARLSLVLAPLLILGIVAAGCGEDDNDDTAAGATSTAPATDDASGTGTNSDAATDVVAVDYHLEGLPERVDAGTRLTMHNDSEGEVHELVAMAIPTEETRPVDELVALPEGELFAAVSGEPALVLVAPPGEDAIPVVGDGTLDTGRYLVVCAIPTGADPDEFMRQAQQPQDGPPDVDGGPPHFTAGMYAELLVD